MINDDDLIMRVVDSLKDQSFLRRTKKYFAYGDTLVRLQMQLSCLPSLGDIAPFYIKPLDIGNAEHIRNWIEIISDGYEEDYDLDYAMWHFQSHTFLDEIRTWFIMEETYPIATISVGKYRSNRNCGGDARIAVRKEYRGQGLGRHLILYGFHQLREQGVEMGETMIAIKRSTSIYLHLTCGFRPQTDVDRWQYKDHAFFLNRILANRSLERMQKVFLESSKK